MAYQYQEFPKWKYHYQKPAVIVSNKAAEDLLGPDWYNSPADVKPPDPKFRRGVPKPEVKPEAKPELKDELNV